MYKSVGNTCCVLHRLYFKLNKKEAEERREKIGAQFKFYSYTYRQQFSIIPIKKLEIIVNGNNETIKMFIKYS